MSQYLGCWPTNTFTGDKYPFPGKKCTQIEIKVMAVITAHKNLQICNWVNPNIWAIFALFLIDHWQLTEWSNGLTVTQLFLSVLRSTFRMPPMSIPFTWEIPSGNKKRSNAKEAPIIASVCFWGLVDSIASNPHPNTISQKSLYLLNATSVIQGTFNSELPMSHLRELQRSTDVLSVYLQNHEFFESFQKSAIIAAANIHPKLTYHYLIRSTPHPQRSEFTWCCTRYNPHLPGLQAWSASWFVLSNLTQNETKAHRRWVLSSWSRNIISFSWMKWTWMPKVSEAIPVEYLAPWLNETSTNPENRHSVQRVFTASGWTQLLDDQRHAWIRRRSKRLTDLYRAISLPTEWLHEPSLYGWCYYLLHTGRVWTGNCCWPGSALFIQINGCLHPERPISRMLQYTHMLKLLFEFILSFCPLYWKKLEALPNGSQINYSRVKASSSLVHQVIVHDLFNFSYCLIGCWIKGNLQFVYLSDKEDILFTLADCSSNKRFKPIQNWVMYLVTCCIRL